MLRPIIRIIFLTVDSGIPSTMRRLQYEEVYTSSDDDEDVPLAHIMKKSEDFTKVVGEAVPDAVPLRPEQNDFVVVKFINKKFVSHFVGLVQISHLDDYPNDFLIRFLKQTKKMSSLFQSEMTFL